MKGVGFEGGSWILHKKIKKRQSPHALICLIAALCFAAPSSNHSRVAWVRRENSAALIHPIGYHKWPSTGSTAASLFLIIILLGAVSGNFPDPSLHSGLASRDHVTGGDVSTVLSSVPPVRALRPAPRTRVWLSLCPTASPRPGPQRRRWPEAAEASGSGWPSWWCSQVHCFLLVFFVCLNLFYRLL